MWILRVREFSELGSSHGHEQHAIFTVHFIHDTPLKDHGNASQKLNVFVYSVHAAHRAIGMSHWSVVAHGRRWRREINRKNVTNKMQAGVTVHLASQHLTFSISESIGSPNQIDWMNPHVRKYAPSRKGIWVHMHRQQPTYNEKDPIFWWH
jgi:hypothetical protein